ncbi:MAG: threonine aldolase [Betaproteobacteria bacterium RIFCSPLOWO2_02_FULL_67_26]|nr:MAG: threonine aldolase [Betaproteobacteria bacterium RIFCSPLOWO2_02_FULL_67_26]
MIDLRSDTVTRPTEAMLESMREATFGDDSRDGDETVRKLEALAAARAGKEAGAFMPSGTMANLVAMLAHAGRGGEVLLEDGSHTLNAELGGIAGAAGLFHRGIPGRRGAMDVEALREAVRPLTRHHMGTALVWMENTHNRAGGAVLPLAHMAAVHGLAREKDVPVHLDGARLFNAAVALGCAVAEISAHSDSVCFCVSKGLSAPVGSILCGTAAFIERARACRRMVGGNMRQAGPLAAAGIVALETMTARLAEDHQSAKRLAEGFHRIDASLCDPKDVETNLVRADVRKSGRRAAQWSADLKAKGVLVAPADIHVLRFVTHRHISAPDVDAAVSAFAELWKNL